MSTTQRPPTNMLLRIAGKEIEENLRSYRFIILTGLLGVLILVSVVISYGDYRLRLENYNILRPQANSADVMIPPNPLSIFAKGLDANLGRLYEISILGIEVHTSQQSVNRLFALFAVPDMLFTIKVMLAFIALLFSFDAICGEKESGTLKLLLANGARRTSILFGKLLGRFALVYVPFVLLFLLAAVVVSLLPDVQSSGTYWQRIGVMMLLSGIYVLAFTLLGLLVSSWTHEGSAAMVLSLGFWVAFVFVIPNMGTTIARSMAGIPPTDRVEMQGRLSAIQAIYERIQREERGGDGKEGVRMIQQIKDANSQLLESYRPLLNRLVRVTTYIVRLSPTGALTLALTDVADTGLQEEYRLKDAIVRHFNRNFDRIVGLEKGSVGRFDYRRGSLLETFATTTYLDASILVVFCLGFLALAMVSFLRYDPR